jgi:hypothetical protein
VVGAGGSEGGPGVAHPASGRGAHRGAAVRRRGCRSLHRAGRTGPGGERPERPTQHRPRPWTRRSCRPGPTCTLQSTTCSRHCRRPSPPRSPARSPSCTRCSPRRPRSRRRCSLRPGPAPGRRTCSSSRRGPMRCRPGFLVRRSSSPPRPRRAPWSRHRPRCSPTGVTPAAASAPGGSRPRLAVLPPLREPLFGGAATESQTPPARSAPRLHEPPAFLAHHAARPGRTGRWMVGAVLFAAAVAVGAWLLTARPGPPPSPDPVAAAPAPAEPRAEAAVVTTEPAPVVANAPTPVAANDPPPACLRSPDLRSRRTGVRGDRQRPTTARRSRPRARRTRPASGRTRRMRTGARSPFAPRRSRRRKASARPS